MSEEQFKIMMMDSYKHWTMTDKKQTAVDYLLHATYKIVELNYVEQRKLNEAVEKAKAMEKEVAQQYAEFAIECDRKELPVLEFDGWINL